MKPLPQPKFYVNYNENKKKKNGAMFENRSKISNRNVVKEKKRKKI